MPDKIKTKRVYNGVHISAYVPPELAAFIREKAKLDNDRESVSTYLNNHFRALMQADKKEEQQHNGKPNKS